VVQPTGGPGGPDPSEMTQKNLCLTHNRTQHHTHMSIAHINAIVRRGATLPQNAPETVRPRSAVRAYSSPIPL